MSLTLLGAFAAACFLSCVTPGVAVGLVISQSLRHSFRISLWGLAGLQAVAVLNYALVGVGLMGLIAMSPRLFNGVRLAGALYLIWIGLRTLWNRGAVEEGAEAEIEPALKPGAAFWQGFVAQFCNAYGAFFYVSLVPQFLQLARPLWPQLGTMLGVTIAIDTIVLGSYAAGASTLARLAAGGRGPRVLNILSGLAMLAIGLKIAIW